MLAAAGRTRHRLGAGLRPPLAARRKPSQKPATEPTMTLLEATAPFSPPPRAGSLVERVYAELEERIVTLRLQPGTTVSEAELSAALQVSRTPLRQALQRLVADNLVIILPRKGLLISEVNFSDHLDILETRRALEGVLLADAARRAGPEQRTAMTDCAEEMLAVADAEAPDAFMRLDKRFDDLVEQAARNRFASRALAPLHAHCRRFWFLHLMRTSVRRSAELHHAMAAAVVAGDPAACRRRCDELIAYLTEIALQAARR